MSFEDIFLKVPTFEELSYRQKILMDPETMSYNKGYGEAPGYDSDTGCIDFCKEKWTGWYAKWVQNDRTVPHNYYAYILRKEDNLPVGEVALRYEKDRNAYCTDIIIEGCYRGKGYSEKALRLLLEVAFNELKAEKVYDNFSSDRVWAEKVFLKVGYKRVSKDIVEITRDEYVNHI